MSWLPFLGMIVFFVYVFVRGWRESRRLERKGWTRLGRMRWRGGVKSSVWVRR